MRAFSILLTVGAAIFSGSMAGAQTATGDRVKTLFGRSSASVTYGPYIRLEAGRSHVDLADPNWFPPGPTDPRVFFDFANHESGFASLSYGYDWMNGFRGDVGLVFAGKVDATGPWSYTIPVDPGPHADITAASVSTRALMGSIFYSPLEQRGVNSRIQPYLVAGLGLAQNKMSDWTRVNIASPTPVRTFAGKSSIDLAYSVGLGVAVQLTPPGNHPVMLDIGWRYYDFGTAEGSTQSLSGAGGTPREALNVKRRDSVISLSVRVPLKRF
jgi:opacity protein-like surface antigen